MSLGDQASQEQSPDVRLVGSDDLDCLAGLLLATRRHYWGAQPSDREICRSAAETLVQGRSGCEVLLCMLGCEVLAYATFSILLPSTNERGTFFMKDLFVLEQARSLGVGALMMRRLARLAADRGCPRFDWTAETDNPRALAFYDALGAERVTDKVYYRFSGQGLAAFAAGSDQAKAL